MAPAQIRADLKWRTSGFKVNIVTDPPLAFRSLNIPSEYRADVSGFPSTVELLPKERFAIVDSVDRLVLLQLVIEEGFIEHTRLVGREERDIPLLVGLCVLP